jgi:hypothetical protein
MTNYPRYDDDLDDSSRFRDIRHMKGDKPVAKVHSNDTEPSFW